MKRIALSTLSIPIVITTAQSMTLGSAYALSDSQLVASSTIEDTTGTVWDARPF